jgi:outer membrane biosynthesis protein TonB
MHEEGQPPWTWIIAISLLLHFSVFLGIWWLEQYSPRRTLNPSVISVSLVDQPMGQQPRLEQVAPDEAKAPEIRKRIPRPVPKVQRKVVSITPPELKLPEREKSTAKEPESEPPRPTADAKKAGEPRPTVAAGPAGRGGGQLNPEEARYLQVLRDRIMENWRAYLPPEEGVLGEVQIEISSDGRISEFDFKRGSGKEQVDASIVRALKRVVLPPPPSTLAERPLLLRFWPYGPES